MSDSEFHGIRANSAVDAFVIAATAGSLKEMQLFLDEGVDINAVAEYKKSPALAAAAGRGVLKAVNFLLEKGADIEQVDGNELTPLMNACSFGKKKGGEVALRLIEAGADVNAVRSGDQKTALKFAVSACEPAVIKALIDSGADVNGPAGTRLTALMIAAQENNVESLKVLIEKGADATLPCLLPWAERRTALGLAEMNKAKMAVAFLKGLG